MSIFKDLAHQLKGIGKLYYDTEGNSFLYNSSKKEIKEITLYSPEQFRHKTEQPSLVHHNSSTILGSMYFNQKAQQVFDNVRIYSVKIEERGINGKSDPILHYGFIDEKGWAITQAIFDNVEAFCNGYASVCHGGQWCKIDLQGRPILNGSPIDGVDFIFNNKQGYDFEIKGFTICCKDGKYGLINKYRYLCIPCEYDRISFRKDSSRRIHYIEMEKWVYFKENRIVYNYTAIIENDSICNILHYSPTNINAALNNYGEGFLIIEETFKTDGNEFVRQGLLNRGGLRILESEFDKIDIVSEVFRMKNFVDQEINSFAIVSKDDNKRLLLISETGAKVIIDNCSDIKYGEGYVETSGEKLFYAIINGDTLRILMKEDDQKNHKFINYTLYDISPNHNGEYNSIYFVYDGYKPNNYIAAVAGNKTKLYDLEGEEIMPLVIPSEYHVETDTYSEGIVGVSILKQETDSDGNTKDVTYYSYIDSEGKLLSDFKYKAITKFENGRAMAYYKKYGDSADVLDTKGNIIQRESFRDDFSPLDSWRDYIDDAFEGDSGTYWNID